MPFCIGWVKNFDEITLSCTVKEIEANCVLPFLAKIWKFKMASIFEEGKIFWKLPSVHCLDTFWVENFDEIALSRTVKEIEANCVLPFLAKIWKFKMAAIFGEGKIFWKLPRVHFSDTLWIENFDEIALSRTVKEIVANLCFSIFWHKFENTKWPPFLGRGNFFENYQEFIAHIPSGSKISMKSLYLARLRR